MRFYIAQVTKQQQKSDDTHQHLFVYFIVIIMDAQRNSMQNKCMHK